MAKNNLKDKDSKTEDVKTADPIVVNPNDVKTVDPNIANPNDIKTADSIIPDPNEIKSNEPPAVDPDNLPGGPDYSTDGTKTPDGGEIALSQDLIGEQSIGKTEKSFKDESQGIFEKVFHNAYGIRKHYLKFKRKQIETIDPATKLEIMVYEDDGKECAYFENMNDADINSYKKF